MRFAGCAMPGDLKLPIGSPSRVTDNLSPAIFTGHGANALVTDDRIIPPCRLNVSQWNATGTRGAAKNGINDRSAGMGDLRRPSILGCILCAMCHVFL